MPVKQKKPEKFKKKKTAPVKHKAAVKKPSAKKKKEAVVKPPTVVTEVNPSTPEVSSENPPSVDQQVAEQMQSDVATATLAMAASPSPDAQAETVPQQGATPAAGTSASASAPAPSTPATETGTLQTTESVPAAASPAPAVPIQGEENVLVNPTGGKSNKRLVVLIVILILLLVAAGGEVHLLLQLKHRQEGAMQNAPVVATHKPLATPTPTVDITKYTITVLNGSGIAGEAAKVKDMLTKDGFSVSDVGNATNSAFTNTIIQAKTDVSATVTKKLKDTLSTSYQVAASISALPKADTGDIVVIVGSTKQENQ